MKNSHNKIPKIGDITSFLNENNNPSYTGHTQQVPQQVDLLKSIIAKEFISSAMQIGFNAGHSAEIFLSSNRNVNLVSFDLGEHASAVELGQRFIDNKYPNRHELILGDSLITVPEYIKKNSKKFDLIFIDGGHDYDTAFGDIQNCARLAHEKTTVILDDTITNKAWIKGYNRGPNKAWDEAKKRGIIKELGSEDYQKGRGNSWGIYSNNIFR